MVESRATERGKWVEITGIEINHDKPFSKESDVVFFRKIISQSLVT